jgi:4'-phosphopantetheinyl transferase
MVLRTPSSESDNVSSGDRNAIDLWYFIPKLNRDPANIAAEAMLLSPAESEKSRRFHFERDRQLFVTTRAFVRTVLSTYAPVAPGEWRFAVGTRGKPHISSPELTRPIYFNLAHTEGLIVCLVSRAHESIGIDAEVIREREDLPCLAESHFSPSERSAFRSASRFDQTRLFYSYWTLKESFAKARGDGLSLPLDHFSFHIAKETIRVSLDPSLGDNERQWQFALLDLLPDKVIAVAAKIGGSPLTLRIQRAEPPELKRGHNS